MAINHYLLGAQTKPISPSPPLSGRRWSQCNQLRPRLYFSCILTVVVFVRLLVTIYTHYFYSQCSQIYFVSAGKAGCRWTRPKRCEQNQIKRSIKALNSSALFTRRSAACATPSSPIQSYRHHFIWRNFALCRSGHSHWHLFIRCDSGAGIAKRCSTKRWRRHDCENLFVMWETAEWPIVCVDAAFLVSSLTDSKFVNASYMPKVAD